MKQKSIKDFPKSLLRFDNIDHNCFVLYGPDYDDFNESEIFFTSKDDRIVVFDGMSSLLFYFQKNENELIDFFGFPITEIELQSLEIIDEFDLNELKQILIEKSCEKILSESISNILVSWLNLFSDYANQINDKELIAMFKDSNIQSYWDYYYNNFVWSTDTSISIDKEFDFSIFKEKIKSIKNQVHQDGLIIVS